MIAYQEWYETEEGVFHPYGWRLADGKWLEEDSFQIEEILDWDKFGCAIKAKISIKNGKNI